MSMRCHARIYIYIYIYDVYIVYNINTYISISTVKCKQYYADKCIMHVHNADMHTYTPRQARHKQFFCSITSHVCMWSFIYSFTPVDHTLSSHYLQLLVSHAIMNSFCIYKHSSLSSIIFSHAITNSLCVYTHIHNRHACISTLFKSTRLHDPSVQVTHA
jgi:hypothetical protein